MSSASKPPSSGVLNESWRYNIAEYAIRITLPTLTLVGLCFWWTPWPSAEIRQILALLLSLGMTAPIILAAFWLHTYTWIRDLIPLLSLSVGLFSLKIPISLAEHLWIGIAAIWLILENILHRYAQQSHAPIRTLLANLATQGLRILTVFALYTAILPSETLHFSSLHSSLDSIQVETGSLFLIAALFTIMLSLILHQTLVAYRAARLKSIGQTLENLTSWSLDTHIIRSAIKQSDDLPHTMQPTTKTIMMGDIRGFTSFCERTPTETVVSILEKSYTIIEDTVAEFGGAKCEFIADAFLTSFTKPSAAIDCALELSRKIHTVLAPYQLGMGIGITHGPVLEGIVGGQNSKKYTLIGHTVNAAARIQGEAEAGEILATEEVIRTAKSTQLFQPLGELQLKGITHPLKVYSARIYTASQSS
ncbi:MAG: adenylate/guanylate cyclase domain-containing protein [Methylacidiphilales bacterium]|nr:adenylate/guanylate cyclase domain-containing protein [Candidatus Methylacidiphilales bacterium]MDW8350019.1 adenylate/guanylate cyclase domain-containing protein [Verrucomicrobiae bacterium]